jgi:hypothetical protein
VGARSSAWARRVDADALALPRRSMSASTQTSALKMTGARLLLLGGVAVALLGRRTEATAEKNLFVFHTVRLALPCLFARRANRPSEITVASVRP